MARPTNRVTKPRRRTTASTERPCLRCDRVFWSEGPHNRLCDACRVALAEAPSPAEAYHIGAGHRQGADAWR